MRMSFSFIAIEKGKAWFVPMHFSGIVEADLDSCKCNLITRLGYEGMFAYNVWGPIKKNGDYLAVAPLKGENFYLYNLQTKKLKSLSIEGLGNIKKAKFWASFCKEESVYFVGSRCPWIVRIDTKNEQIEIIKIKVDSNNQIETDMEVFGREVSYVRNEVFIPLCYKHGFITFDLGEKRYNVKEIGNYYCNAICGDNQFLCLIPKMNKNIEIYDLKNNNLITQIELPAEISGIENAKWYCTGMYHCGYVWIIPYQSNMILRLDLNTREVICVKKFYDIASVKYSYAGIYDDNRIWGFYCQENRLDIIDCRLLQIESKYFLLPDNISQFIEERDVKQILTEKLVSFDKVIPYICALSSHETYSKDGINVGRNIWRELRD